MARRTLLTRAGKLQLLVTPAAFHRLVLSREDKPCLLMLKGRIRTHAPGIGRVARLARDGDLPMRRHLRLQHR